MNFGPRTLADYDAVLSVSGEAVNRQLEILYNMEIDPPTDKDGNKVDTEATELEDYAPPPRAKYMINHDISIHPLITKRDEHGKPVLDAKGNPVTVRSDKGIDGHIRCPRISFTEDPRYVRVHLKFFKDDSVLTDPELASKSNKEREDLSMSWLSTFDANSGDDVTTDLAGYEMSWVCLMATKHIQDVMEDLIKPAESAKDPTAAPQHLIDKLKGIPPEDFLVSAMFCAFESVDAMNSFQIIDEAGKELHGPTIPAMMGSIVRYFQSMTSVRIPNPNNPFVLGYGISQKLPTLSQTNSNINRDRTPKYFIPKRFDLTATKGANAASKGTLNYCMITHRNVDSSGKEEERVDIDPRVNKKAGNLSPDFFSLTKMSSATSDAVMAFSSDTFMQRFIIDTLFDALHIDLEPAFDFWQSFTRDQAENKGDVTYSNNKPTQLNYGDWSPGKQGLDRCVRIQRTQICRSKDGRDAVELQIPALSLYRVKSWQEGFSQTTMVVESNLAKNTSGDVTLPDDFQRSIRITCTMVTKLKFYIETHLRGSVAGPADDWSEAYTSELLSNNIIVFDLTASVGGTWNLGVNKELSTCPLDTGSFADSIIDVSTESLINGALHPRAPPPQPPGGSHAQINHGFHGVFSHLDFLFGLIGTSDPMSRFQRVMFTDQIQASMDKVSAIMQGFDHTVIMPGGEAFSFTGLDTDKEGAIYSHLTYKAGTTGATKKVVPEVVPGVA